MRLSGKKRLVGLVLLAMASAWLMIVTPLGCARGPATSSPFEVLQQVEDTDLSSVFEQWLTTVGSLQQVTVDVAEQQAGRAAQ